MKKTCIRFLSIIMSLTLFFSLSACGEESETNANSSTVASSSTESTPVAAPAEEEKVDPLGKYDEKITLTSARFINEGGKYKEGESENNNIWTRTYLEELNIELKYLWIAPTMEVWTQKMNVAIATNNLPDFMELKDEQYVMALEADLLQDLTGVYDKYASDLFKEGMSQDKRILEMAKYKGKMYSIPQPSSPYDASALIWARSDWMKNLGLEQPKSMDDVIAMIKAFTKNDPDKNNKDDTYGIAVNKNIFKNSVGNLKGFFEGYHAYVNDMWILKDGELQFGAIQPEAREALAVLASLYKEGCIDPEFGVKADNIIGENFSQGKLGLTYGVHYAALSPLNTTKENNPDSDFNVYPIVSADNEPALTTGKMSCLWNTAVSKNCKYPEAIIKMANLGSKIGTSANDDVEVYKKYYDDGGEIKYYAYTAFGMPGDIAKNYTASKAVVEAMGKNDPSRLLPEFLTYYNGIMKWVNKDPEAIVADWGTYKTFAAGSSWQVIGKEYLDSGRMLTSEFFGSPTASMGEKKAILEALQIETYMKIITGYEDISAFDKFVTEWKNLGGDQVTKEVNEWYKGSK